MWGLGAPWGQRDSDLALEVTLGFTARDLEKPGGAEGMEDRLEGNLGGWGVRRGREYLMRDAPHLAGKVLVDPGF